MNKRKIMAIGLAVLAVATLSACDPVDDARQTQLSESTAKFDERKAPDVTGQPEYNNYNRAQLLYDDPNTIQWCTVFPPSDVAPIHTVAIAGKLTSSSVSYYPGQSQHSSSNFSWSEENQSIDGMYHGSPPPYRYGFTPGGEYVDFTDLPVECTTALTSFQRQTLSVSVVAPEDVVTQQIADLLKAGDPAGAQALVDGLSK
jgi:hypothetical protein